MDIARQLRTSFLMMIVLTVLVGLVYTLAVTGIAQVVFPWQANGSLVRDAGGNVVGSAIIGQSFASPAYFHTRPSAAGADGYDATASGGSNLAPTNQKLVDAVKERAAADRQENGLAADAPVPVDAVTASGSGLDPEITPANAGLQVARVAAARKLAEADVRALVERNTAGRTLGFLGEPRVNVLALNRALDEKTGVPAR
jgi:potassium-transporting ATPase KdpC subunit